MLEIQNDINRFVMIPFPDLNNLPEKSYREKLSILIKFVKNWSTFEGIGQTYAIDFFMSWVGKLYLEYFQYHLDEAKACGQEHQGILRSIMEPIEQEYILVNWRRFSKMASDIDYVYDNMCEVRTNLEAFQEMFAEITGPFGEWIMKGFCEDVEAHKDAAIALRDDQIPKNTPRSHWWWFYESKATPEDWDNFYERNQKEKT